MLKKSFFIPLLMFMSILMTGCAEELTEEKLLDFRETLVTINNDMYTNFEELYTYDGDYDKNYRKQVDLYLEKHQNNIEKIKKFKKMKLPKELKDSSSEFKETIEEVLETTEIHENYLKDIKKVKNLEKAVKINEEHRDFMERQYY
ncbi:Uncharacterised protein [Lysinibacillus capsici]|uniref:Lipoprotein n=1 Tax=Lysinibacillus capsici TaxID=2115968 RepID=A0A2X1AD94_9BACI|nr:hypothetical protein [Lysinibacillus capsici]SPU38642.1 Uncharacterised protein [Lysinibacillus capsici]